MIIIQHRALSEHVQLHLLCGEVRQPRIKGFIARRICCNPLCGVAVDGYTKQTDNQKTQQHTERYAGCTSCVYQ